MCENKYICGGPFDDIDMDFDGDHDFIDDMMLFDLLEEEEKDEISFDEDDDDDDDDDF